MRILITGGSGFIGTNVIESFSKGYELLNIDLKPPNRADHEKYWKRCDILDKEKLVSIVCNFRPDRLLHLGAATGVDSPELTADYFEANTEGVNNLIAAIDAVGTVQRTIFVSSLLVCRNGYVPLDESDYNPPNAYGQSKMKGEIIVRQAKEIQSEWVIVRPTGVWGPWFEHSYRTFFQLVARGLYFNIREGENIVKPVTFVGNTSYMFEKILSAASSDVNGETFYLGDYPEITVRQWAEAIRYEMNARRIPSVPLFLAKGAAKAGDMLKMLGWRNPPLSTFRLNNIMTGGRYPLAKVERVVGRLPFSLQQGVHATAIWMREFGYLN